MSDKKRYTTYNTHDSDKPWNVIILDYEWWDKDKLDIDEWFSLNGIELTLFKGAAIVRLTDEEYSLWQLAWG